VVRDGWAGHVLILDLTRLKAEKIDTTRYKRWGGGHGLATALFWDYCEDKTITDGRDPANVCILAASPFCGTLVPSGGGRTEVTGVGTGQWPVSWYTRSNFGGRFSSMMKYAGWDAIVITGKAERPIWLDIRNGDVAFRDAAAMWGADTHSTQKQVWAEMGFRHGIKSEWKLLRSTIDAGRTTQKSAILSIGPIGENTVHGALLHDAGNGAGQGGFGSVWGSKNLKAISLLGTGEVHVADPAGMIQTRFLTQEKYVDDPDAPDRRAWTSLASGTLTVAFDAPPTNDRRPQACQSCIGGCRTRYRNSNHNEQTCQETGWYGAFARRVFEDPTSVGNANLDAAAHAAIYGINTYGLSSLLPWLDHLHEEGILGPDGQIKSNLPFDQLGRPEFVKALFDCMVNRTDIGADLAEGYLHALHKWGREEDLETGVADFPYWGMANHGYDPRAELEWGYGTLMSDRDFNSHDINNHLFWGPFIAVANAHPMRITAEVAVQHVADKLVPYAQGRTECLNYNSDNMYSEAVAQLVRWHLHYGRFYKNSLGLCDFKWANFYNTNTEDFWGATASDDAGEHVWWRLVTGEDITFAEGIERGRQIYNLDNAIWTLQGRHRDVAKFAPYIYSKDLAGFNLGQFPFFFWPAPDENGKWEYREIPNRHLDEDGFESWKTTFYRLEGWDHKTGWPTRPTLESMDMAFVADELEAAGKLGEAV
jgi:aldehyde:ferredoxin oxidoreductase